MENHIINSVDYCRNNYVYPELTQVNNAPVRNFGIVKVNKGGVSKQYVLSVSGLGYLGVENGKLTFEASKPLIIDNLIVMKNNDTQYYDLDAQDYDQIEALGFVYRGKTYYIDVAGRICSKPGDSFHDGYIMFHNLKSEEYWQNYVPEAFKIRTNTPNPFPKPVNFWHMFSRGEGEFYSQEQKEQMEKFFLTKMKKLYSRKVLNYDINENATSLN